MASNFAFNLNLNNNEIQNVLLQKLAADPTNVTAKIYYNTTSNTIKYYNGTSWQTVGTGVGSGDVVGPASATDGQIVLFDGATGKLIKAATISGLVKATSGVISAASAGTDYLAPAAIGTTVQAYDATLAALASYNTNGILTQTAADTFTGRTITGTAGNIVVTDGNGVAGNPTINIGANVLTDTSTHTLTNKTFNANGTGNSITNIEVADFASGVLNTSTTLSGATDSQVPSALAVKTYVDNSFGAVDAFTYQGGIDASTNPNYPAADAGDVYKITVAGKIGGASGPDVQVGDTLYCTVDASASGNHATVGTNWTIVQANVDRATDSTLGLAEYATQAEAEAKTSALVALTPASIVNFPQKKTFTIGDGAATSFPLTHSLNTLDIVVSIRKVSTGEQWFTSTTCNSVNQVTLTFATAPTNNEFVVTVIG